MGIVDVSDPRQPVEVADWGARRDAGSSGAFDSTAGVYGMQTQQLRL
jgi:hypothetical protein